MTLEGTLTLEDDAVAIPVRSCRMGKDVQFFCWYVWVLRLSSSSGRASSYGYGYEESGHHGRRQLNEMTTQ